MKLRSVPAKTGAKFNASKIIQHNSNKQPSLFARKNRYRQMSNEITLRVAAKGLVVGPDGRVLILREARTYEDGTNHGRYHFPGGRLNLGEKYKSGLQRELIEETGLKVEVGNPIFVGEWFPEIKGVKHQIVAIFSVCYADKAQINLSVEHDRAEWIDPKTRGNFDIMDPDWEVIDKYNELKGKGLV